MVELSEHSGMWIILGLLLGWIFRDAVKSAFEKFTGVFWNPIYQPPNVHWKGIDQNLFENPNFSIGPDYKYCRCGNTKQIDGSKLKSGVGPPKGPNTLAKEGMCGCAVNQMYDWDNRAQRLNGL